MARSPNPADQPCVSHSLVQIRQSWQQRIMYPSQSIFSSIFSITLSNCAGSPVCSTWEETSSKVLSRSFSSLPQITVKTGEKHSTSEWNCFLISWNFSTFSAQGETCKLVWSNVQKRLAGTSDPGRSKLKTQHNWKQGDDTPEVALVAGFVTALRLTFFHAKLQDPKSYVPWIDCHHPLNFSLPIWISYCCRQDPRAGSLKKNKKRRRRFGVGLNEGGKETSLWKQTEIRPQNFFRARTCATLQPYEFGFVVPFCDARF